MEKATSATSMPVDLRLAKPKVVLKYSDVSRKSADMPKRNKKRRKQPPATSSTKPSIEFSTFNMPEDDREKLKAAMLDTARRSVTEFPETLELVKAQFRSGDPVGIMNSFATYGLMRAVIGDSVGHSMAPNNIQQHHAELLQAVLLTIPFEEWGAKPVLPGIMQTIFDTLPLLSDTFVHQRVLAAEQVEDKYEKDMLFLLERIRFHTQAVRNWGYFGDVKQLTVNIYGPLDSRFRDQIGFGISELVKVASALVADCESRASEHFRVLQEVLAGKTAEELVRFYYRHMPDLIGNPEEFIAAMPTDVTREGVLSRIMTHLDYRLAADSLLKPGKVSAVSGLTIETVEAVLRAISLAPGELKAARPEHLFLSNPVWTAPGIDLGDCFFVPMPQLVFSHIHPLVARLGEAAGLERELERARSRFLETKVCEVVGMGLPGAAILRNPQWLLGDQQFETDCVAVIDRVVVIVEAKSSHLTPAGLRGAPDRLKRHIQELVLDPSIQSARLEKLIADAKGGDEAAGEAARGLGLDVSKVDKIIRLSVTLDDLSALHSAESEFKQLGWVPDDHELAPTISIADLIYVTDILESPLTFLHYLIERLFVQKEISIVGDELDLLGLYLETGFHLGALEESRDELQAIGMSSQMDRYYISRDEGIKVSKPQIKVRPRFRRMLDELCEARPDGWIVAGLNLLNVGDYFDQKKLERGLDKLMRRVRKRRHDTRRVNVLQIQPIKNRKARLVFYVYPKEARERSRSTMERLAFEALEKSGSQECCVFGKCIDNWQQPYEAVCIVRRRSGPHTQSE